MGWNHKRPKEGIGCYPRQDRGGQTGLQLIGDGLRSGSVRSLWLGFWRFWVWPIIALKLIGRMPKSFRYVAVLLKLPCGRQ